MRVFGSSSVHALQRSAIALAITAALLSAPVCAQEATTSATDSNTATDTTKKSATDVDAVVVTGIRGSVYRAQDIKRDSDTFVDSVTALDIGALPDRSVTETLSRIPGVTIDHFLSVGDPEHFSAEGSATAFPHPAAARSASRTCPPN
jgi:hypothetical protein